MDKILQALTPGKSVGLGAVLLTIAGWITQMEVQTEAERITQMVILAVLGLGILVLIFLAQHSPSPQQRKDD